MLSIHFGYLVIHPRLHHNFPELFQTHLLLYKKVKKKQQLMKLKLLLLINMRYKVLVIQLPKDLEL